MGLYKCLSGLVNLLILLILYALTALTMQTITQNLHFIDIQDVYFHLLS